MIYVRHKKGWFVKECRWFVKEINVEKKKDDL